MRPADLARASGIGRDSISGYQHGRTLPTPGNAAALATVLGVTVQELLGVEAAPPAAPPPIPAFGVSAVPGRPDRVRLQMDREINFSTLVKIGTLLEEERQAATPPA